MTGLNNVVNLRSQWKEIFDKQIDVLKIRYIGSKNAKGEIEQFILQVIGSYGYSAADDACGRLIEYIQQENEKCTQKFDKMSKEHSEKMLESYIEGIKKNIQNIKTSLNQIAQRGKIKHLFIKFINKYTKHSMINKQILIQLEALCTRSNKFLDCNLNIYFSQESRYKLA